MRKLRIAGLLLVALVGLTVVLEAAWTNPMTWAAGHKVTASEMNTQFRDNLNVLRGGGIAITSQASKDFVYADTATQFGRLAAVSGKVPYYNGAAWEMKYAGELVYPVDSLYTTVKFAAGSCTNPNTTMGFGTWTAFGAGRVMVGFDSGQTEFDAIEETGGAKTHTLTTAEMPAHAHPGSTVAITDPGHTHTTYIAGADGGTPETDDGGSGNGTQGPANPANLVSTNTTGITATPTIASQGGGGAHNNLQPYIAVCMWKRTS